MRLGLIVMALTLIICNAQGIMYLTSGSDAYGEGLSYPGYGDRPAIAGFVAADHTSRLAPVFLGATLCRPEFANISSINRSYYNLFIDSGWHFRMPTESYPNWSALGSSYDGYVPAVREFVQPDWKPKTADYQVPALQKFMEDESEWSWEGWKTPERSSDDYPGIDTFLDEGDEAPERHLI